MSFAASEDLERIIEDSEVKAAIEVLDIWVQFRLEKNEIPGVSIGIVYDQELIWTKGYGYADLKSKKPTVSSTVYRIASLTKLFTATSILQLRDAGKLQLYDPVNKYLDWFTINDEFKDTPELTIMHILTHSSGLPREFDELYWDNMIFPDSQQFITMFQESSTILGRDEKFKYSNIAFSVLGFLIEKVSGESYADYVTKYILEPLGMNSTTVLPSPEMPQLATGYKYRNPGHPRTAVPFTNLDALVSAGNIASTVEDLAKFISLQFRTSPTEEKQILRGSTIREMHRVHWLKEDWSFGRGLGWGVKRVDDRTRIRHGGYVWGYTSSISAVPADKIGVIVLTNAGDGSPGAIADQVWKLVAPVVRKATDIEKEPTISDLSWKKFVGDYVWSDGSVTRVMLLNNELLFVSHESDNPWESRLKVEFVKGNTFKIIDGSQEGELITFELDDDGEVIRVIFPGYAGVKRK